jgi:hypothetical protein
MHDRSPSWLDYLFFYWSLGLFRECGIIGFSMGLWNCSDSVALFVFLLNFGDVPTLWHYLFLYWNLELFRQRGIIGFSIGLWNCSDSVALLVFLLDFGNFPTECIVCFSIELWRCSDIVALFVFVLKFGTVPTAWHYLFLYWTLELFRQCGIPIMPRCRNSSKFQYKNKQCTLSENFQSPIEKPIMPHCRNSSKVQ